MSRFAVAAVTGLAVTLLAAPATALGVYDFAYVDPAFTLEGRFTGEAIDADRVQVLSLQSLSLDAEPFDVSLMPVIGSWSATALGHDGASPDAVVSFSGLSMDWIQHDGTASFGFAFFVGQGGDIVTFVLPPVGSEQAAFDAGAWTLTEVSTSAVPTPAAGLLLLAAMGGLAALRRRG